MALRAVIRTDMPRMSCQRLRVPSLVNSNLPSHRLRSRSPFDAAFPVSPIVEDAAMDEGGRREAVNRKTRFSKDCSPTFAKLGGSRRRSFRISLIKQKATIRFKPRGQSVAAVKLLLGRL